MNNGMFITWFNALLRVRSSSLPLKFPKFFVSLLAFKLFKAWFPLKGCTLKSLQLKAAGLFMYDCLVETRRQRVRYFSYFLFTLLAPTPQIGLHPQTIRRLLVKSIEGLKVSVGYLLNTICYVMKALPISINMSHKCTLNFT